MSSMKTGRKTRDPLLKKFGEKIRMLRKRKGLSQEQLAAKASLHWTYISGIEQGLRNISLRNIFKISKALKVKPRFA